MAVIVRGIINALAIKLQNYMVKMEEFIKEIATIVIMIDQ